MFQSARDQFFQKYLGSEENHEQRLHDFWSGVLRTGDPRIEGHPMRTRPDWMRRAIPVSVHGDAVPVIRVGKPGSASLECLSLQSLFADGPTLRVKILMFSMFEANKVWYPSYHYVSSSSKKCDNVSMLLIASFLQALRSYLEHPFKTPLP